MLKKVCALSILLSSCLALCGQLRLTDSLEVYHSALFTSDSIRNGTYTDLEKAYANKDDVYYLNLMGYGLDKFPEIILDFPNLTILRLSSDKVIIDTATVFIPNSMRARTGKTNIIYERRNFITSIPCELNSLKNLKYLSILGIPIPEKEVNKLALCLLGVYIQNDFYY